jgi:dTMP kinase
MLITLEGLHGSGKTTQGKILYDSLKDKGLGVEYLGSKDKKISKYAMNFLNSCGEQDAETLFYLSLANNYTLNEFFQEDSSKIFIVDRYIHTDLASTFAEGKSLEWMKNCISPFRLPDLTFLFDLDPEDALLRKGGNVNDNEDRTFLEYQARIREAYLELAKEFPEIKIIDASVNRDECRAQVLKHIDDIF